jgi:hypothetical protein
MKPVLNFGINLFFYFLILIFSNNCMLVSYEVSSVKQPSSENAVESGGGNGSTYDGKLTFINTELGFMCENQPAPKSVIRRTESGVWNITVNESTKCAQVDRQILADVFYSEGTLFLKYNNQHYNLDNRMPDESSSLAGLIQYYVVDAMIAATTNDQNPGDRICADITGKCSLQAAIDEAELETLKVTILDLGTGTYVIDKAIFLTSGTLIPSQIRPAVIFQGIDPLNTVIDAGNATQIGGAVQRNVELKNIGFKRGYGGGGLSPGAFTPHTGALAYYKNCNFTEFPAGSGGVIDLNPGDGTLIVEDSKFFNNANYRILNIFGPESVSITNSEFFNNSGYAIDVHNGSWNINILNSKIYNNYVGVHFRKCYSNCSIINTQITGHSQYGLYFEVNANQNEDYFVKDSIISGNGTNGGGANLYSYLEPLASVFLRLENSSLISPSGGNPNCVWGNSNKTINATNSITDDASCGF